MTMSRNVPLGYLKSFLVLLVVAHHAVLAYLPSAPPRSKVLDGEMMIWAAFPVVDGDKWPGTDLFVGFNDTFFMSLLFLISGVFVWSSLARKGAGTYLRERFSRLGIPFLLSAAILAPLAYYPAFVSIGRPSGSFWGQWLSIGKWPAGPAWFLWVLLVFACIAAAIHKVAPAFFSRLGAMAGRFGDRPLAFFGAVVAISALGYLPMAAIFGPMEWVSAGPFFVQASRILHYAAYFFIGIAIGTFGLDRGLLAANGKLARRWPLWIAGSVGAFVLAIVAFLVVISTLSKGGPGPILGTIGNFTFVLSSAATSFACLAVFGRFATKPNRVADSLGANAFGIYLLHYACVSWLQLALLDTPLSGAGKGTIVFAGAVALSWALSAVIRRILWMCKTPLVNDHFVADAGHLV